MVNKLGEKLNAILGKYNMGFFIITIKQYKKSTYSFQYYLFSLGEVDEKLKF